MSPRTIGVAVGLPEPYAAELQKWREKLGDPMARAIPPHVTLVPPTEVDAADMPPIEEHLRAVAERQWPFEIRLRGTGSFRPVSPVVFVSLAIGISGCERLEQAVRSGPLDRPRRFNYHPHVTVAHDVPDDVLDRAFAELADYEAGFEVVHFGLFERGADGVWRTEREFPLRGVRR
ncbi:MAG: 2'-5' RNA ligase family protein [Trebonia sp.]